MAQTKAQRAAKERKELEDVIVRYLAERSQSRLRGRFFDVGDDSGRREYAEWLAGEITSLNEFSKEAK